MPKFYITTAIPYVNAPPHIGHALELIQADVIARRERLKNKEVFFLTGTDEHGLKNWRTSLSLGEPVYDFVTSNANLFKELLKRLNISNDFFIRTTDRTIHWPTAEKLWQALVKEGDIYKKIYRGLYCLGHESFHTESEIVSGECPDYPGKALELVEEENYFFRLSKYSDALKKIIGQDEIKIIPQTRKNEVLAFIERGLEDISFSRPREKLPWGIPVPDDQEQIMYVWCDALSNYLSGVGYKEAGAKFQKFWPPDLQVIGKDILRFHAIIWPAMLLSAKLPLPKVLLVHGFITSGGQKMSKTLGNVIDPFEMQERYSSEAVRYFLLREIPTTEDGDFTEEKLKERYNSDLANGLGNLLARVVSLGEKYGKSIELSQDDLYEETKLVWQKYENAFSEYRLHEALEAIWNLIASLDRYLNQRQPWKLLQIKEEISSILSSAVIVLANISWMLKPFLPETSDKIFEALNINYEKNIPWNKQEVILKKQSILFPRKL